MTLFDTPGSLIGEVCNIQFKNMTSRARLLLVLSDIRFWIIFFFLFRLIGITNAPLEIGHNWRQSLTAMTARNFYEGDANLLYPRIDMSGNQTGIIGSEFPFFNYLIYLFCEVFGYAHWYGRLINLIVSSIGIYFFYRLTRKICSERIAFSATIVLITSVWFSFSRKIMPDTFSVSLVIIGLFYCYEYLVDAKKWKALLFFLFITVGMLCKIPALSLLAVIPVLLVIREISRSRKLVVILLCALAVIIVGIWYFYWVPYLVDTYHYQLYFPKGLAEGFREILPYIPEFFQKFYFSSLYSYVGFAFCLAGIVVLIREKNFYLKLGITLITVTFFLFILKTGAVFPLHNYYIIPFIPIMALLAGMALAKLPGRYTFVLVAIVALEGIANQQYDFFIKEGEKYKLTLEEITQKNVPPGDLIVINGGQSPQQIYFAHRKGWTLGNERMTRSSLDSLRMDGATYLIIEKRSHPEPIEFYPSIYQDEHYEVYRMAMIPN